MWIKSWPSEVSSKILLPSVRPGFHQLLFCFVGVFFSPPPLGICVCFPSAHSKAFFFSLFLNSFHISFIHNCFLDCFPLIELILSLLWVLLRCFRSLRQNKFASGNFILYTIFCGFHHHASKNWMLHMYFERNLVCRVSFPLPERVTTKHNAHGWQEAVLGIFFSH